MNFPHTSQLTVVKAVSALALSLSIPGFVSAGTVVLYDGSVPGLPASQGWLAGGAVVPGAGSETPVAGGTRLDSSASNGIYAGYSNRQANVTFFPSPQITPGALQNSAFPDLIRANGFTLSFTVQQIFQSNDGTNGPDRAGLNVTLIASDSIGIELGFQSGRIFAQSESPIFTAAEATDSFGQNPGGFDIGALQAAATTYDLTVIGNTYTLKVAGQVLLTGSTRDYSSFTGLGEGAYDSTNFIFLGDNTTSARGTTDIFSVSLTTIPEPSAAAIFAGLAALGIASGSRGRAKRVRPESR